MEGNGFEDEFFEEPERESDEEDNTYWNRVFQAENNRKVIQPEPGEFKTPKERFQERYKDQAGASFEDNQPVNLRKDFGKLQIIVKLANICLTPEKPTYEGGSWHVEGQLNESM